MAIPARIEGETDKAYQAFCDYCAMGAGRSLSKLFAIYQRQNDEDTTKPAPSRRWKSITDWSANNDWQIRVRTYDDAVRKERDEADLEIWKDRRKTIPEEGYQLGQKLLKMAVEMAEQLSTVPLVTKRRFIKGKDGEPDREIIQVAPNFKALATVGKLAIDLQRQAADLRPGVDVTTAGQALGPSIYLPALSDLATPEADEEEADDAV